jgi:leader peptidase (prepilin peptidase)/N-methyltransferase
VRIVLGLLLVTALVPITLIDLELRLIPNLITGPAALAAVVAIAALDTDFLPEALIAGAAAGGFFLLAALMYPRGMGMGDVKLAGMLGLYLGRAVAPAIFIALIAGVAVGAAVIARKGAAEGRKTAVPFGPFLALGGIIAFFAGADLVDAYLNHF